MISNNSSNNPRNFPKYTENPRKILLMQRGCTSIWQDVDNAEQGYLQVKSSCGTILSAPVLLGKAVWRD